MTARGGPVGPPAPGDGDAVSPHAATHAAAGTLDAVTGAASGDGASGAPDAASEAALELHVVAPARYAKAGELGRGGLGRVWRAEDRELGRPVAIKELLPDSNDQAAARFVREALITARLQHPGIVPVYESGRWPDGEPFYAMKLISGRPLHDAIAACRSLDERLALLPSVLAVAETIAYAHGRGVIHRDLKPANVVLGEYGEAVVIDWGLAKDRTLAAEVTRDGAEDLYAMSHAEMTRAGAVMGTPVYMPPEQARGEAVDERADVYALGAILYRLLAGVAPFEGASGPVLAQVLAGPPPRLATRDPGIPRDLVAIVDKAMARAPAERYPTAKELAQDLSRFLTGQLVGAREYSRRALIARFVRRHRLAVAASLVVAAVLAVSSLRVVRERDVARARTAEMILTQARAMLEPDPTAALAWLKQYPADARGWNEAQAVAAEASGRGVAQHVWADHAGVVIAAELSPDGAVVATASRDVVQLWDARSGRRRLELARASVRTLTFSPDGLHLLTGGEQGDVVVFEVATGRVRGQTPAHRGWVNRLLFAPDGQHVVSMGPDGPLRVWRWSPGGELAGPALELRGHEGIVDTMAIDRGGRLWSSGRDGTVRRWDLATGQGEVVIALAGSRPRAPMAVSGDGEVVITVDGERVVLWRHGEVSELGRHRGLVRAVVLRVDGTAGASAGEDGVVTWWTPGGEPRTLAAHERAVGVMALAADGETVATGDVDGTVRLWRGGGVRVLRGHTRALEELVFAHDGSVLLTASDDGSARLWPARLPGRFVPTAPLPLFRVAISKDGGTLVSASKDGGVRAMAWPDGPVRRLGAHSLAAYDLALTPDGRSVVTSSWDGSLVRWDLAGAAAPERREHGARIWGLDVAPDGSAAVSAGSDGKVRLWPLDGAPGRPIADHGDEGHDAVFSPDGARVASSGSDERILVTELAGGPETVLSGHEGVVSVLVFARDGRTLYSGGFDGAVRAWDLRSAAGRVITRHQLAVRALALSPDGRWLASGSEDKEIELLELDSGRRRRLRGHRAEVRHLAFSPDGRWLASAGWDETVRLWRVADGSVTVLRGHSGMVHRVAFSPDGRWLVSGGEDGSVGAWQVAELDGAPAVPSRLRAWLERTTTAAVSPTTPLATAP